MLFDDDEQLEVRHVVSLAHHDISIYSGGDNTPEGELFIKRNAICLTRRSDGLELGPDSQLSKPFYLFSENCSTKEDFYFALLRNQEQTFAAENKTASPLNFEVEHIISLVQKLHYSEEHLQTRWLNAMIGRLFLSVYKTKDVETFIREKLTKKISRVKRPSFLSNIEIKSIDTGDSAPYITNPRLKDLTVAGECGIEADFRYTGNFRLEVATTARIDLGSRFKAREVNLVLAVVVRKLEGHALLKIKPPPSNRIWFSFQQMPKIEMTIEPIVSSRQITYTLILRQIENRIKEVIAETLVLPFWDDTPFFKTDHKQWRGGIFAGDDAVESSFDPETSLAQMGDIEDVERLEEGASPDPGQPAIEKSHSLPVVEATSAINRDLGGRVTNKGPVKTVVSSSASTTGVDVKRNETPPIMPRPGRSGSLVHPPTPIVGTDATHADIFKPSSSPPDQSPAATAFAHISKSQASSPAHAPATNPFKPYITSKSSSHSSMSSREATDTEKDGKDGKDKDSDKDKDSEKDLENPPKPRRDTASSAGSYDESRSSLSTKGSIRSQMTRGLFSRRDTPTNSSSGPPSPGTLDQQKRTALAAVTNAAVSAKRWGLSALQRHQEGDSSGSSSADKGPSSPLDLNQPMGRGRPLPPPGVPLPMPDRKTKTAPIPVPPRKPVPPPILPGRSSTEAHAGRRSVPPPPLPKRRQVPVEAGHGDGDGIFVVEAPADSEPTTPLSGCSQSSYVQPWVDDGEIEDGDVDVAPSGKENGMLPAVASTDFDPVSHAPPSPPGKQIEHELDEGEDEGFSAWTEDTGPTDSGAGMLAPSEVIAR